MQSAIDELFDKATFGDSISNEILNGKTTLVNGDKITRTMPNNGAWTSDPITSTNVTIPEGYHDGEGYVNTTGVYNAGYGAALKGPSGADIAYAGGATTTTKSWSASVGSIYICLRFTGSTGNPTLTYPTVSSGATALISGTGGMSLSYDSSGKINLSYLVCKATSTTITVSAACNRVIRIY